jgi:hypothetical protein
MVRASASFALVGSLVAMLLAPIANADVYKYKDEKGNVQYTDRPVALPAERVNIQSQRTDVVAMENRETAEQKAAADRDKGRQQSQKAKGDEKKNSETSTEGKAEACNTARKDYLARMNAQRLLEEQANGERRYLTDKEIDASRNAAKTAMDAVCN